MHHTDTRQDDPHHAGRHPTDWASARRAFWVVAALIVGCSSSDDVVAEVEPTVALSPSVGVAVGSGTFAPPSASGVPVGVGSTAEAANVADPNATGPSTSVSRTLVPLLPLPPGAPAVAGALSVSGTPRTEPGGSAQLWPFLEPLRQVFGVPTPGAPGVTRFVTDPLAIQTLRELAGEDGVSPIVDPALVTVVDAMEDRYDLATWDSE